LAKLCRSSTKLPAMRGASGHTLVCGFVLLLSACGGSQKSAPAAASESTEEPEPVASSAEPAKAPEPASADAVAPQTGGEGAPVPREIRYVVTPAGLEIRVEGVDFLAKAAAERVAGGWSAKVVVTAEAKDEQSHSLLSPKNGPLAFAGATQRGEQSERFADERSGDGEQRVVPDKPLKFSRSWPGKSGAKPLSKGDRLELDVGLWGIGETADKRRPVKSFFRVVLAIGQGKPDAQLSPPSSAER
jgi:hypothetical protein